MRRLNLTNLLITILFVLMVVTAVSVVALMNIKPATNNNTVEVTAEPVKETIAPTPQIQLIKTLGKGKYAEEIIEPGFEIVNDGSTIKYLKDGKTFNFDSSMFSDDEKQRIIKNVLNNVKNDKEKYGELSENQDFINSLNDFNTYFDKYEFDSENITITHSGEPQVSYVLSYTQSSLFMAFMFTDKGFPTDEIQVPIEAPIVKNEIDPSKPMIALTFDDGPSKNDYEIVAKLKEYNARATFYVLGKNVGNKEDIINTILDSGCEIGGHSWDHTSLVKLSGNALTNQFTSVRDVVKSASNNGYEIKTFRPPYGAVNEVVKGASPFPLIMWDIDTLDWKTRNAKKTVDHVLKNVKDGSIILMHDIHSESKDAAIELIPILVEKGYQLVTISELMEAKNIQMQNGVLYFSGKNQ